MAVPLEQRTPRAPRNPPAEVAGPSHRIQTPTLPPQISPTPELTNQQEDDQGDGFEHFLTPEQLPYYRNVRRWSGAVTRLNLRLKYLRDCKNEGLIPISLTIRIEPPQGLEPTSQEITAWKTALHDSQQAMLEATINMCTRELSRRQQELTRAQESLNNMLVDLPQLLIHAQNNLTAKRNNIISQDTEDYDQKLQRARARHNLFQLTTKLHLLNKPNRSASNQTPREPDNATTPTRNGPPTMYSSPGLRPAQFNTTQDGGNNNPQPTRNNQEDPIDYNTIAVLVRQLSSWFNNHRDNQQPRNPPPRNRRQRGRQNPRYNPYRRY